jgi:hypothetical protein
LPPARSAGNLRTPNRVRTPQTPHPTIENGCLRGREPQGPHTHLAGLFLRAHTQTKTPPRTGGPRRRFSFLAAAKRRPAFSSDLLDALVSRRRPSWIVRIEGGRRGCNAEACEKFRGLGWRGQKRWPPVLGRGPSDRFARLKDAGLSRRRIRWGNAGVGGVPAVRGKNGGRHAEVARDPGGGGGRSFVWPRTGNLTGRLGLSWSPRGGGAVQAAVSSAIYCLRLHLA